MRKQGAAIRGQGSGIRVDEPVSGRLRRLVGPAIILAGALLATVPQWIHGASCGHDFDFHLVSWLDALQSWRHGVFYPHWTPSANYGAGEPRFVFYPPLTWMLGAALGAVLPWRMVPGAMTFLLLAATGLATRALARRVSGDGPATLAGCVAIFSGYALFTAYERSAFAEMTGGFWAPLLLMFLLRDLECGPQNAPCEKGGIGGRSGKPILQPILQSIFEPILDWPTFMLALILAGAWLSNAPVGVMIGYLLAGVGLTAAVLARSLKPLLRAGLAGVLGTGLAAFYLVPAAWEQRWVDIRQAVDDPGYRIENSWLFARHADARLELHDVELLRVSAIGASMVAVALAGLLIAWWRRTLPGSRRWWIPIALIPAVVLFLQLPPSLPVWNVLPKLRFLQFPWRWLVVLEGPVGLFFAAALWTANRWQRTAVVTGFAMICLATTAVAGISFSQACDDEDAVRSMVASYQAGDGFEGTDEYAPPGADNSLVATGLPSACLVSDPEKVLGKGDPDMTPDWSADQGSCEAVFGPARGRSQTSGEHWRVSAQVSRAGYLILRLRDYPAWRVRVNGKIVTGRPVREDGLMAVPVPPGPVQVAADWTTTPDVTTGRGLSLVSMLAVAALGLYAWRRGDARL